MQNLPGFTLAAVGTRSQDSADAAAEAIGAERGYGNPEELFADPAIDVVTVAVRVPAHRDLILGALEAGKHVISEWPLVRDLPEAEELQAAAAEAPGHAVVGLQARISPAVREARARLERGAIGRVLSARLYDSTIAFGPETTSSNLYLDDPANGATHVRIHGGHSLDLARFLLGELSDAKTLASIQYGTITVDGAARQPRVVADHLLVLARSMTGAPLNVEVAGRRPVGDTPFRFDIVGESGTISLVGGAARGFQSGRLELEIDGQRQHTDAHAALPDAAINVAGLYAALRNDIENDTTTAPDFSDAVELTRLISSVE